MKAPEYLITVPIIPEELHDMIDRMPIVERVEFFAWTHNQIASLETLARILSGSAQ